MKRILSFTLAALMLFSVCSCNNTAGTDNGDESKVETIIKTNGDYEIHNVDMGGKEVRVFNLERFNGVKMSYVQPGDSDDTLEVAIYESNKRLEEQFNFTLVNVSHPNSTWEQQWIDMGSEIIKNANSGDDVYDFLSFPVSQRPELVTNGYIMDLSELDGFHFDQPWWDQKLNASVNINGHQYVAGGPIHTMVYDGMTGVLFNKTILANYGLESPYELVRSGDWTIDAMVELAREGMNLNADKNWWVLTDGTSTYGITMHRDFPAHFLIGAGIQYVTETDGDYQFNLESEDFYLAVDKLQAVFTHAQQGGIGGGDASNSENSWMKLFGAGRSLLMMCELKNGIELRENEIDYGILPLPKLRSEQEEYYSDVFAICHLLSIPTTSANPEDVSIILDAMAYDRYNNVIPVYYDSHITYKGLRDEESLEMLEIMSAGRTMDPGIAYGWCYDLITEISYNFTGGTITSMIAAKEKAVNDDIDFFLSNFAE